MGSGTWVQVKKKRKKSNDTGTEKKTGVTGQIIPRPVYTRCNGPEYTPGRNIPGVKAAQARLYPGILWPRPNYTPGLVHRKPPRHRKKVTKKPWTSTGCVPIGGDLGLNLGGGQKILNFEEDRSKKCASEPLYFRL